MWPNVRSTIVVSRCVANQSLEVLKNMMPKKVAYYVDSGPQELGTELMCERKGSVVFNITSLNTS